jgi:hypothetical protein
MKKFRVLLIVFALLTLEMTRCVPVKPYQRVYLNDSEMSMGPHRGAKFDEQVQVYREGASGGGSQKGSGGCGCN